MKSNVCPLIQSDTLDQKLLAEVEKCALYNGLEKKSALRLTLLAEELIRMLPNLTDEYEGSFWLENKDQDYELHATLEVSDEFGGSRDSFLSLSKSGKNAAAKGIVGKIRSAIEAMIANSDAAYLYDSTGLVGMDMGYYGVYNCAWTLDSYVNNLRAKDEAEKGEAWDELEKSVIAKLADDVIVGVKGRKVELIIKKKF